MTDETLNAEVTGPQTWTAEQTAHPDAKADRWALIYDPTPGGRDNGDGTRSFSLRFPALLLSDCVDNPKTAAHDIAKELNEIEALRARVEAAEAKLAEVSALREGEDMLLATRAYRMAWADIEVGHRKRDPRVILLHARAAEHGIYPTGGDAA